MSNNVKKKLGWLPGSYRAATQLNGPYKYGPAARGAFDGPYDNGPARAPAKGPSQGKRPPPYSPASNARKTAEAMFKPAPIASVKPPSKPKHWKTPPFGIGDIIICSARDGNYRPCECGHIYMTVGKGSGQIPAKLRCQRCGKCSRELRKTHVL
jgi:hypothetical protein